MVLHVRDDETDRLVRSFAEQRGVGITEAIREAVQIAMEFDKKSNSGDLRAKLAPLLARLDKLPRTPETSTKEFFDDQWGQAD